MVEEKILIYQLKLNLWIILKIQNEILYGIKPKPEDLACIFYTNKLENDTRAVMFTHSSILSQINSLDSSILAMNENDIYMTSSSLYNIPERAMISYAMTKGTKVVISKDKKEYSILN